jgi:hypothetical protein
MWRGFVKLSEVDQHAALDSDKGALTRLGSWFVEWFLHKAALRSTHLQLTQADLLVLLVTVARATEARGPGPHSRLDDWVYPLRTTGLTGDTGAQAFLREAASAGVVELTGSTWAWRHAFLPQVLIEPYLPVRIALEGAR